MGLKIRPREGMPASTYDDAVFIAKEAEKLAGEGKDVVLIAHYYGGVSVNESGTGVGKEKEGGIVRLAYIAALVSAGGTSAVGVLADVPKSQ